MICGHCLMQPASIQHVRSCAIQHGINPSDPPAIPTQFWPEDLSEVKPRGFGTAERSKTSDPIPEGPLIYRGRDEIRYYLIVPSKEGRRYAKRFDVRTNRYVYDRGAYYMLQREADDNVWEPLSLEEAKSLGLKFGICMVCGAILTNPVSVEAGIGPICAGRFDL